MILLNFSHPLTPDHLRQVETLTGRPVGRVIDVHCQIDPQLPLAQQVTVLANQAGLSPAEWQTLPLLVNPPSLNFIAVVLLAELHGRCGYFPAHLRLRPVQGRLPPQYEVAEVLDLQALRDAARRKRC
jgi:hypothetical protein